MQEELKAKDVSSQESKNRFESNLCAKDAEINELMTQVDAMSKGASKLQANFIDSM